VDVRSRRGFLKALAVAPVLPAGLAPQAAPGPAAAPPASDPVAEAQAQAVLREYAEFLDPSELDELRREIERNRAAARRLRAAARLENADEPAYRFEARLPFGGAIQQP
jgi:hypothetical protein